MFADGVIVWPSEKLFGCGVAVGVLMMVAPGGKFTVTDSFGTVTGFADGRTMFGTFGPIVTGEDAAPKFVIPRVTPPEFENAPRPSAESAIEFGTTGVFPNVVVGTDAAGSIGVAEAGGPPINGR
jgi:hypothetical protein